MCIEAIEAGPAEMVGNPVGLNLLRQLFDLLQIIHIQSITATDRHGDPMHDDRVALTDLIEKVARFASGNQIILGQHLEPLHVRSCFKNRGVVFLA